MLNVPRATFGPPWGCFVEIVSAPWSVRCFPLAPAATAFFGNSTTIRAVLVALILNEWVTFLPITLSVKLPVQKWFLAAFPFFASHFSETVAVPCFIETFFGAT